MYIQVCMCVCNAVIKFFFGFFNKKLLKWRKSKIEENVEKRKINSKYINIINEKIHMHICNSKCVRVSDLLQRVSMDCVGRTRPLKVCMKLCNKFTDSN